MFVRGAEAVVVGIWRLLAERRRRRSRGEGRCDGIVSVMGGDSTAKMKFLYSSVGAGKGFGDGCSLLSPKDRRGGRLHRPPMFQQVLAARDDSYGIFLNGDSMQNCLVDAGHTSVG